MTRQNTAASYLLVQSKLQFEPEPLLAAAAVAFIDENKAPGDLRKGG